MRVEMNDERYMADGLDGVHSAAGGLSRPVGLRREVWFSAAQINLTTHEMTGLFAQRFLI